MQLSMTGVVQLEAVVLQYMPAGHADGAHFIVLVALERITACVLDPTELCG